MIHDNEIGAPQSETSDLRARFARRRRSEEQEKLGRLSTQAQTVAGELARLSKPVALMGVGIGQDDALAARRSAFWSRALPPSESERGGNFSTAFNSPRRLAPEAFPAFDVDFCRLSLALSS